MVLTVDTIGCLNSEGIDFWLNILYVFFLFLLGCLLAFKEDRKVFLLTIEQARASSCR